jgi:Ni2+-binding GTPase involved in maturation of urease and hydrogenase
MDMHLIGGFLGSGKTTAIIHAARYLTAQGKTVAVVTNDKGKHLVDTAFFRTASIPTAEVAGGCFRCNFDQLEERLQGLIAENKPDVIFAESVGSCVDLAETVMKPLLDLQKSVQGSTSFSVFCDVRLLKMWLQGEDLPFSEEVVYIFEQQIAEAPLVVLNKCDLLSQEEAVEVERAFQARYPHKSCLLMSASLGTGMEGWLSVIENSKRTEGAADFAIDYTVYDRGSQQLAWLDESVRLEGENNCLGGSTFLHAFAEALRVDNVPVGHVKIFLTDGNEHYKTSLISIDDGFTDSLPEQLGGEVMMILNGRVQCAPAKLNRLVAGALETMRGQTGTQYTREETAYFRPRVSAERNSHNR